MSFFEIYMSRAYDLFAGREPLEIMEDGAGNVQVVGLTECPCDTAADVLEMLRRGHRARSTASTQVPRPSPLVPPGCEWLRGGRGARR